jgi:DNA-binding beta-propeller fold protein YncE
MQFKSSFLLFRYGFMCVLLTQTLAAQTTATFGDVIQLGGTPSDIVLDESRARLYLVNSPANRVDIYDYAGQTLLGSINVGQLPLSAAMSMDNAYLYVSNHDDSTLSVIGLNGAGFGSVISTVSLPAKPQGVEVGFDGRVLICTDGSGTTSTSNTLLIYDGTQASGAQVLAVVFPPAPSTPPSLATLTARNTSFYGKLRRTTDGKLIVGVSTITVAGNGSNVVYLYEVASGTVLQARTVVGQSPTLAVSPDGASFMAGFTLFDTATLNIIGRQSLANAPFILTLPGSTVPATIQTGATGANVGGSVFSPAGDALYSAFNISSTGSATVANTLLISDPRNLAIRLGINLPESVIANIVVTSDGSQAFASSASGFIHLPLGKLYSDYPILMPDRNVVFLAQDDCNAGVVQAALKINNVGGGTLTFAVPNTIPASLVVTDSSGVAPGTLTFTLDPGRSAVVRTPGTNLYTFSTVTATNAASLGTALNIQLSSPNAINVSPLIRVYMNSRDSTMRGVIYPLPTGPNSTAAAYEGLQDIVLDEPRHLVYITNSAYNRIEVFDTQKLAFQSPIPVGQLPHQMAMGLDGSTLYVANTGGESISVVDLDQQMVTGSIQFPPIPRQASAAIVSVQSMAIGLSGLQLVLSDGTLWRVIGNQAVPRVGTTVTGVATNGTQTPITGPTRTMLGSDDGTSIILLGFTGTAYLYDGLSDAYTTSNRLFGNNSAAISGYFGVLGVATSASFLLADGLVMNRSLSPIGGAASPGQVSILPPIGPGGGGGAIVTSTGLRNVAAVAPVGTNAFLRMTTPVRTNLTTATGDDVHTTLEAVDVTTGATALAARMPENPVLSEFLGARTATTPRQMVVDSAGTVYALTLSGLSVLPLTPTNSTTQPQIATAGGVTNATTPTSGLKPGAFINIKGANLASPATASTLPTPTLLGGSCVLVGNIAIPLLSTSTGLISAQIPSDMAPGVKVLQVRSLATAQQSQRVVVTIQKP